MQAGSGRKTDIRQNRIRGFCLSEGWFKSPADAVLLNCAIDAFASGAAFDKTAYADFASARGKYGEKY